MNLYHLKYFYDSARLGSLTKAAKLNRVGQPAISKAIQNLESTFKKTLISHERNRFLLTEDGEVVFSYCHKVFSSTDEMKDALAKNHAPTGEVRFACPSSMAESDFLAQAIKAIRVKYPALSLKLMLGRTDFIRDWVNNGLADFGIVVDNIDFAGFETELLAAGNFNLIKEKKYKDNWRQRGVMTVEGKSEVIKLHQKYEQIYKERLKVQMEIGSWGVIKKFVMSGMGVGFVPDYMIQQEIKNKLISIVEPNSLSVPYEIKIIRKADKFMSSRCRLAISEFIANAR